MSTSDWLLGWQALRNRLDHHGRIVLDFLLQTLIFLGIFVVFEFAVASPRAGLLVGVCCVVLVGLCLGLFRGVRSRWVGSALVMLAVLASSAVVVLSGGRSVAVLALLPILVFVVVLLERGLMMWLWVTICLALPGLGVLLLQLPYDYPIELSFEWRQDSILLTSFLLVLYVVQLGRAYRGAIDGALEETEVHAQLWREESDQALISEQRFRDFADEAAAILWETDANLALVYVSNGFETLIGRPIETCLGLTPMEVFRQFRVEVEEAEDWLARSERREPFENVRLRWPVASGRHLRLLDSGRPYFDARGRFGGYRGVIQDVTATEEARAELERRATRDALTGLLNRRAFLATLQRTVVSARDQGRPLAVAFVDLDHFKQVNDRGGHAVGDELLVGVGRALASVVGDRGVVGRIGGDEFCVIWPDQPEDRLQARGEDLLRAVTGYRLLRGGQGFGVACSVGIAWQSPATEGREDAWLSAADAAAYAAKSSGRGQVQCTEMAG